MITTLFWVPRGQAAAAVACSTQDPGQEHVPPDVLVEGDPTLPQVVMSESESSEVGLDQVLSFPGDFSEGRDPNLSAQAVDWEQLEAEDERFQDTDWLIFTGRLYADDSCGFEVCVLERPDIEPGRKPSSFAAIDSNVYIHHDGVLAAAPLSSAFTDYGGRCIAAVGTYAPTVELWDLVSTNAVEPLLTLGSAAPGESWNRTIVTGNGDDVAVQVTQKSRKRKRQSMGEAGLPRVDQAGHRSAVLCLTFHPQRRAFLASGSADRSIKCWDIRDGVCATTIDEMHTDKVQALAWNPRQDTVLLSAGFDRRACLVDLRAPPPRPTPAWQMVFDRDPENVVWLSENHCLLSDEGGVVRAFDIRRTGNDYQRPLWSIRPCQDRPALIALAPQVPDMLVVGSTDGYLRIYDLKLCAGNQSESASTQAATSESNAIGRVKAHAGALFSVECCPDENFAFAVACGGSKGKLTIVDVAESTPAVLDHFRDRAPLAAEQVEARLRCLAEIDKQDLAAGGM